MSIVIDVLAIIMELVTRDCCRIDETDIIAWKSDKFMLLPAETP